MPGEISRSNPGPRGGTPFVPSWIIEQELVTVCSKCLRASCFQGLFFCEDYKTAGTLEKTVKELLELKLEHSDYFIEPLIQRD